MNARLCVTVTGGTTDELRANRDRAESQGADMVEVRLDYARAPDVAGVLAGRRRPVIVTCRPMWEGGRFEGDEETRRRMLAEAMRLGADFVDVEWRSGFDDLIHEGQGRHVIVSSHDFETTPVDLMERYRAMRATGAAVVKIAVRARSLSDTASLLELAETLSRDEGRRAGDETKVLIAMGPAGVMSRVLPDRFGSCWTYAGDEVAPGQVGARRLLDEFRYRAIDGGTALYGVVGRPIGHSLSPVMHNAGLAARETDAVYLPLEATDTDDFIAFAEATDLHGASITAPFKETLVVRVAEVDALGRRIGAINTVRKEADGWSGINTDVPGFLEPLVERADVRGLRATVLGAGGAARGVAVALADAGARVAICARRRDKAAAVAALVEGTVETLPPAPGSWDLLVNTTPLGTFPDVDVSPVPPASLAGGMVYDLIYNPRVTRLLADASAAGCTTIGGLGMLVAQAERQFAWWHGARPPAGLFKSVAERRLDAMGAEDAMDATEAAAPLHETRS